MDNINTEQYWNSRFQNDWEMMQGKEQTSFFANIALRLLPDWFLDEVKHKKLSICDFGCAQGQAVDILHRFFQTEVCGADFSECAITLAKDDYPDYHFFQFDMVDGNIDQFHADIGFTSNVLEHLEHPWVAVQNAARHVSRYFIVLIPFRETLEIEEHCNIFDTDGIPLKIADMDLIFVNYMDCSVIPENLYSNRQILLLYEKKADQKKISCLADLTGAFEHDHKEETKALTQKIDLIENERKGAKEQNELLENEIKTARKQNELLENEIKTARKQNDLLNQWMDDLLKDSKQELERQQHLAVKQNEILYKKIEEAVQQIGTIQSGSIYRMGLMLKRFLVQCVYTREKKDFMKWFFCRLFRKHPSTKALREFDALENVKLNLKQTVCVPDMEEMIETKDIHFKKTNHIIIFAAVPFYDVGGGQRSAQLARTYHAMGYQVHYIYGFPCTEDQIPEMFIPANDHKLIEEIRMEWLADKMDAHTIVIFEIPYAKYEPYLDMAKTRQCVTVYEHIDNWDTSLGCMFYDAEVFQRFLHKVDIITVTAKKLGEKIEQFCNREYLYLPNAVNIEIFEPLKQYECPADLKKGKKTLLYFGSLWGEWFEWDKIDYIAQKCPEYEIYLIGDYSGCMDRVRKKKKNVHFLGLKKQHELPAYLKYTDYALLPFQNSAIGAYVSPLKIFEYIAMNVKVLATGLDDIQGYPNVYCSDSKEDWVRVLKEDTAPFADSSAFIAQNNWYARCGELMKRSGIYDLDAPKISVIVLNYNNKNVIGRCVDTLLAHNSRYHYEIIVVDNGSTDGSYEYLEQNYNGHIILAKNTKNGCSSGRNLGVKYAKGTYLCFLDSDQWAISDYWLDSVLKLLKENTNIGAAGWAAGWFTPQQPAGPIVDYLYNRAIDSAKIWYRTDIAYLGSGGLVLERSLFEKIGGFDEFYDPTCFEDTDLSLKIRNAGYELAYCPYIGVMHLPHQTTQSGSRQHAKLMKRNGDYFQAKWKKKRPELLEYYYV